jgi:two-component system, cell cycle sensor histidine kinase and response regulator CckA
MNQEMELQRKKLETLGRLAGNVVHDFNNLLMVIEGYTRMLLEEPNLSESATECGQEILRASERASALTKQLLAFSRKRSVERKAIEINGQLRQMRNMLIRLLGENVRLEYDLATEACPVFANATQLEQVLLNLIVNARDAMPIGGRITVRSSMQADKIHLIIEDNGVGIPQDLIPKIFEPFFTTKEHGKGTGIGLALVDEIIQEWGGSIEVESQWKEGTRFRIVLPRYEDPAAAEQSAAAAPQPKLATILLVEDEDGVRTLIRRVLEQRNYQVFEAATEEAANEIAHSEKTLDLLITDLELAKGDGRRLAQKCRQTRPGLRVLYISGYLQDSTKDSEGAGLSTLQKPFSPNSLLLAVQELLKSGPGPNFSV